MRLLTSEFNVDASVNNFRLPVRTKPPAADATREVRERVVA